MLLMGLLCSYTSKSTIKISAKKRALMHAPQQEVNKYLRWGLRWGLLRGEVVGSVKVVSDASSTVIAGSSSMTTTGTLALFAALWARVLKWNEVQREADQIQDKKQQETKKYKKTTRRKSYSSSSSSSSSELSAERSKSGTLSAR